MTMKTGFFLLWSPSGSFSLGLVISLLLGPGGTKASNFNFRVLESDPENTSGTAGLEMIGAEVNTRFDYYIPSAL